MIFPILSGKVFPGESSHRAATLSKEGFTLVETLMAVLIMSLVGLAVISGIMAGSRAYQNIRNKAHAEMLISTTVTTMQDELQYADSDNISYSAGKISFRYPHSSDVFAYENKSDAESGSTVASGAGSAADSHEVKVNGIYLTIPGQSSQPVVNPLVNSGNLTVWLEYAVIAGNNVTVRIKVNDGQGETDPMLCESEFTVSMLN